MSSTASGLIESFQALIALEVRLVDSANPSMKLET